MLERESQYIINGNNALKGNARTLETQRDYEELNEKRKQLQKKQQQNVIERKKFILKFVAASFTIGVLIMYRYAAVYSLQNQLLQVQTELGTQERMNESLNIDMLRLANERDAVEYAITNLGMSLPTKGTAVILEEYEDTFVEPEVKEEKSSFMEKIKSLF